MSLGTRGGFLHFVFCSASTTGPKLQSMLTVRGAVNVTLGMVMTTTTTTRTTTTRKKKTTKKTTKKKKKKEKMKMKMNYQKGWGDDKLIDKVLKFVNPTLGSFDPQATSPSQSVSAGQRHFGCWASGARAVGHDHSILIIHPNMDQATWPCRSM